MMVRYVCTHAELTESQYMAYGTKTGISGRLKELNVHLQKQRMAITWTVTDEMSVAIFVDETNWYARREVLEILKPRCKNSSVEDDE